MKLFKNFVLDLLFPVECLGCGKEKVWLCEDCLASIPININFKCSNCGEGVIVWAEGTELYHDVNVYSCPYCGIEKTLNRI